MKKRKAFLILLCTIILTGCNNSKNNGENKPKISVNYSAMVNNSSSSSHSTPKSSSATSTTITTTTQNSLPLESVSSSSAIDYSSLVDDIANKVAEKLSNDNTQDLQNTKNGQSASSVTSSSEEYAVVSKPTQTQSATEPAPQEEKKIDNSRAIKELKKQISTCEMQIKSNNLEIENLQDTIVKYRHKQDSIRENELAKANVALFNSGKRTVWVYSGGRGFQQVQDEKAVNEAQQQVDYYEEMISDYDNEIARTERSIEKYKIENESLKEQIVNCQSEIAELS